MQIDALLGLCLSGTLFTYLFIRIAAISRIRKYEPEIRWDYFIRFYKLFIVLAIVALIVTCIFFFYLNSNIQKALIIPGIISVLYGLPFKTFRLRDKGYSKIFLIAFVWAYVGSFLPALNAGSEFINEKIWMLFAANFLFIFAITLPFDEKDMQIDLQNNVKTLPMILGSKKTYVLSLSILIFSLIIHLLLQYKYTRIDFLFAAALVVSFLITAVSIKIVTNRKENLLYFGLLDGTILMQFILVYIASSLHSQSALAT